MSSPPPGYNPEASMLQGGNGAQIHPVMGGGGGVGGGGGGSTGGFVQTENVSLLDGGNSAVIHPVQGGGEGSSSDLASIAKEDVPLPAEPGAMKDMRSKFGGLRDAYARSQKLLWIRRTADGKKAVSASQYMSLDKCPDPATSGPGSGDQRNYDRLVQIIPASTRRILVFPPVRGDMGIFLRCLRYLQRGPAAGAAQPQPVGKDTVSIFSAPFLGDDIEANKSIFSNFLELKRSGIHGILVAVPTHSISSFVAGCTLDPKYGERSQVPSDPILPLMEPTYIVYSSPNYRSGMVFTGDTTVDIPAPSGSDALGIRTVLEKGIGVHSFAIRPGGREEGGAGHPQIVRVYGQPEDAAGAAASIQIFTVNTKGIAFPLAPDTDMTRFSANQTIEHELQDKAYVPMHFAGRSYHFRNPGIGGVYDDWQGQRFTQDEADFLKDMHLAPSVLSDIFSDERNVITGERRPWQDILASFMRSVLDSKCFSDAALLTKRECQEGRDFLNRVYEYYMKNQDAMSLLKIDEQLELQKRLSDQASTLQELEKARRAQEGAIKTMSEKRPTIDSDPAQAGEIVIGDLLTGKETDFYEDKVKYTTGAGIVNKDPVYLRKMEGKSFDDAIKVLQEKYKDQGYGFEKWVPPTEEQDQP